MDSGSVCLVCFEHLGAIPRRGSATWQKLIWCPKLKHCLFQNTAPLVPLSSGCCSFGKSHFFCAKPARAILFCVEHPVSHLVKVLSLISVKQMGYRPYFLLHSTHVTSSEKCGFVLTLLEVENVGNLHLVPYNCDWQFVYLLDFCYYGK